MQKRARHPRASRSLRRRSTCPSSWRSLCAARASGSSCGAPGRATRSAPSGRTPTAAVYGGISPGRVIVMLTMATVGCALGRRGGQRGHGGAEPPAARLYGRIRLRRHRGGADGARPSRSALSWPSFLFGILYQGGAELAFDEPKITRDMIVVIQGFVVLFAGALEGLFRRPTALLLARPRAQARPQGRGAGGMRSMLASSPPRAPASLAANARRAVPIRRFAPPSPQRGRNTQRTSR